LFWLGLLLERTGAENQLAPIFQPEMSGEVEGNAGNAARAVSNNRVNEV
jgi:hypothetical protein